VRTTDHTQDAEGGILKSDESCISNPKLEVVNWTVQFEFSNLGFEMQDSSDFKIPLCKSMASPLSTTLQRTEP
jgi:hypothetical protein